MQGVVRMSLGDWPQISLYDGVGGVAQKVGKGIVDMGAVVGLHAESPVGSGVPLRLRGQLCHGMGNGIALLKGLHAKSPVDLGQPLRLRGQASHENVNGFVLVKGLHVGSPVGRGQPLRLRGQPRRKKGKGFVVVKGWHAESPVGRGCGGPAGSSVMRWAWASCW